MIFLIFDSQILVEQHCCKECVLYYDQTTNPFKEFMRLISNSPALRHIVIAIAALHLAYRKASPSQSSQNETQITPTSEHPPFALDLIPKSPEPVIEYQNALYHKQMALHYLSNDVNGTSTLDDDATIASILLFVWFEAIESGKQSWKYHLDGVRELIRLRTPLIHQQGGNGDLFANNKIGSWSLVQEHIDTTYTAYVDTT
jgi:Fungal specific transcription factor domain